MSALPPKADIAEIRHHIRFVLLPDSCSAEMRRSLSGTMPKADHGIASSNSISSWAWTATVGSALKLPSSRTVRSHLEKVPPNTKSIVVGDLIMTNHGLENSRRKFLLTVAGGIAGLAAGSLLARVLAQPAGGPPLSISTIGAGRMGGALGAVFVKAGHRVMFSSRHPDTLKGRVEELGPLARVGTVAEAVEFGDVVMVVVPYTAMEQIGKDYGNALAKKVLVIDVSNPIARRDSAEIVKWVDDRGGAGLATAKLLPGAHIVRAFNAIGSAKLSADSHRQEIGRAHV